MGKIFKFESEAAMCEAFISVADAYGWQCYAETCGFDILAVHRETGFQCGIEAKQSFNIHVLTQCVDRFRRPHLRGPDLLAVLVPHGGTAGLDGIARRLGVSVMRASGEPIKRRGKVLNSCKIDEYGTTTAFSPFLPHHPDAVSRYYGGWAVDEWTDLCPSERCKLPDYIPDVAAGCASPLTLTSWKVKAIKIVCLIEKRGYVTASDFKELQISMSRWTQGQWLKAGDVRGRWVAGDYCPDFKAQHPRNFDEIAADIDEWGKTALASVGEQTDLLTPAPDPNGARRAV